MPSGFVRLFFSFNPWKIRENTQSGAVIRRMESSIIQVGRNCWRQESAGRVAFLVDAAHYFEALYEAFHRAQSTIWILGWDIHSRTPLMPHGDRDGPTELADVLRDVTQRNPELRVRILTWDPAPIYLLEREFTLLIRYSFNIGERVKHRFASDHTAGASHHQKVVVVDNKLAFTGGIDLTLRRWDTREHRPNDPRRVDPSGASYRPFHDVQLAVDGEAAAALGSLFEERWRGATGRSLESPQTAEDPWPDSLRPDLRNVSVGFARTRARYGDRSPVREVEQLYLDGIAAAERFILIENQYLTSSSICDALEMRLVKEEGPEVLILAPREQSGRLAELSMGAMRSKMVRALRAADKHARLRIVCPIVGDDVPVNLHAKVMVIDDVMALVGSANISNRSLGLDTECDAVIEAGDNEETRAAIGAFRDGLIAEHLGVSVKTLRKTAEKEGSLLKALEGLGDSDRYLEELQVEPRPDHPMLDKLIADPEGPLEEQLALRVVPDEAIEDGLRRVPRIVAGVAVALLMVGAAAWWMWHGWPDTETLRGYFEPLRERAWGPPAGSIILALATLCMLPVNALIIAAVFVFGPWVGAAVSMGGSLLGACGGYGLGRVLWRQTVRKLAGSRVNRLATELRKRGVLAVVAIRLFPGAPYVVVNLVAGSAHVKFRDFLIGTFIGMTPGILVLSLATDRILAAARKPTAATVVQAFVVVILLALAAFGLHRFLKRQVSLRADAEESKDV